MSEKIKVSNTRKICRPIENKRIYPNGQLECSNCGAGFTCVYRNGGGVTCVEPIKYNYCPECGFKIAWNS